MTEKKFQHRHPVAFNFLMAGALTLFLAIFQSDRAGEAGYIQMLCLLMAMTLFMGQMVPASLVLSHTHKSAPNALHYKFNSVFYMGYFFSFILILTTRDVAGMDWMIHGLAGVVFGVFMLFVFKKPYEDPNDWQLALHAALPLWYKRLQLFWPLGILAFTALIAARTTPENHIWNMSFLVLLYGVISPLERKHADGPFSKSAALSKSPTTVGFILLIYVMLSS